MRRKRKKTILLAQEPLNGASIGVKPFYAPSRGSGIARKAFEESHLHQIRKEESIMKESQCLFREMLARCGSVRIYGLSTKSVRSPDSEETLWRALRQMKESMRSESAEVEFAFREVALANPIARCFDVMVTADASLKLSSVDFRERLYLAWPESEILISVFRLPLSQGDGFVQLSAEAAPLIPHPLKAMERRNALELLPSKWDLKMLIFLLRNSQKRELGLMKRAS